MDFFIDVWIITPTPNPNPKPSHNLKRYIINILIKKYKLK